MVLQAWSRCTTRRPPRSLCPQPPATTTYLQLASNTSSKHQVSLFSSTFAARNTIGEIWFKKNQSFYKMTFITVMMYGHPMYGQPLVYSPMTQQVSYPMQQSHMMAQSMQQYTDSLNPLGLTSSNYEEVRHLFTIYMSYLHNFIVIQNLEWTSIWFICILTFCSHTKSFRLIDASSQQMWGTFDLVERQFMLKSRSCTSLSLVGRYLRTCFSSSTCSALQLWPDSHDAVVTSNSLLNKSQAFYAFDQTLFLSKWQ